MFILISAYRARDTSFCFTSRKAKQTITYFVNLPGFLRRSSRTPSRKISRVGVAPVELSAQGKTRAAHKSNGVKFDA